MTAALLGLAGVAQAATVDLTCPATNFQLNFTPPLSGTNKTATVTGSAALAECTTTNPAYRDLQSGDVTNVKGTATVSSHVPDGLCGVLFTATGTATIQWQPAGKDSNLTFTVSTDPTSPSGIALSATITSGPLKGDTVTAAGTAVPNCTTNGLASFTSTNTVVVFTHQ
ncbi:hypothetical protein [Nocardia terpenica]|uniref:Uncharacterized protein n=1 Tax=Nocardia terpenica TaxID=455432 RepID=A0A6G9Z0B5_9NOCA|nr:hypothetical protein [Nocardia terpenica]QIS18870.1 hypothetical protein F6W96_11755 [Nocardia terpenica]